LTFARWGASTSGLLPVYRAVLHALHARHAWQGRGTHGVQPPRLPVCANPGRSRRRL